MTTVTTFETLVAAFDDHIGRLEFTRPERRNSNNRRMVEDLREATDAILRGVASGAFRGDAARTGDRNRNGGW